MKNSTTKTVRSISLPPMVMAVILSLFFVSCSDDSDFSPISQPATYQEQEAGTWRTLVLQNSRSVAISTTPNERSSAEQQSEIEEMKKMQSTVSNAQYQAISFYAQKSAVIRWNEYARELVIRTKTVPPKASRIYALLSVAQYDALIVAYNLKYAHKRLAPYTIGVGIKLLTSNKVNIDPCFPSDHGVVAAVSRDVLSALFPQFADEIARKASEHMQSRVVAGINYPSDMIAADELGKKVATLVMQRANNDNSQAEWNGTVPPDSTKWKSKTNTPPLLPAWGSVKTWVLPSVEQADVPEPPAYGSQQWKDELAEVRYYSDNRTEKQLKIAQYWADGAGTYTPPGHWNEIAAKELETRYGNEVRIARVFAYMNMAMMDAGICCWYVKYKYWTKRPSDADPNITTPVGLPNFPAYTSGHSSFSGAGATVLSYFIPEKAKVFRAQADEAAMSRLYGGIHYRSDNEVGLLNGREVGRLVVAKAVADGL